MTAAASSTTKTVHVKITRRALQAMQKDIAQYPFVETGGLLLGRQDGDTLTVYQMVDGGQTYAKREKASFCYDYGYVQQQTDKICAWYKPEIGVIGVWHKHNCIGGDRPFSDADEIIHMQLLQKAEQSVLSILFESDKNTSACQMRTFVLQTDFNHICVEAEIIE
ncbi:MAG: hypothetical protein J6L88_04580 [Clostridia bacterium]|nr:hypothetical protein [Clostridia bacterium]